LKNGNLLFSYLRAIPKSVRDLTKLLKNPLILFGIIMISYSFYSTFSSELNYVIRSDGRGYYAYLPALIIFNDSSFQSATQAENEYHGKELNPLHLIKSQDGGIHNKYFPGVAVLQSPFFLLATAVSWLAGQPVDGYSDIYSGFFYFGSLVYALLGLWLFSKVLFRLFPDYRDQIRWLVPLLYMATPLFHYSVHTPSFGHLYSFFLFSWFSLTVLQLKEHFTHIRLLRLGAIFGLIILIRPTNALILLSLPLLLGSFDQLKHFLTRLWSKSILHGIVGFFAIFSLLLLIWKWESGDWIVWSYSGEGFTFWRPHLISNLFSYRIGIFVHTPVLILMVIACLFLVKKAPFQTTFWFVYFLLNAWVISSWWCWDYESPFGNRPFTEHFIFLCIPLVPFLSKKRVFALSSLILFASIGILRLWSFSSGYMTNQRFTSSNYFSSLMVWKSENFDRWNYTLSCKPFGECVESAVLLKKGNDVLHFDDEFILTVSTNLPKPRTNERYYYEVSLNKQVIETPISDIFLVVDAFEEKTGKRFYASTELFNDRYEGEKDWTSLTFQGTIHDNFQEYDFVKIYIYNPKHRKLALKNVKMTLGKYKS